MAVAFDAVGPSAAGAGNTGAATLSWTHTAVANGVALLVGCSVGANPDGAFSVTATCDGGAMTPLTPVVHANNAAAGFIRLFGLANQASGAHAVVVTAAGGTPTSLSGGSVSLSGADPAAPFRPLVTATGTGASASASITSALGSQVFALVGDGSGAAGGWGATATSRWANNISSGTGCGNTEGATIAATGSAQALTDAIASDTWAVILTGIQVPNVSGAGGPTERRPSQSRLRHHHGARRQQLQATFGVVPVPVPVLPALLSSSPSTAVMDGSTW